MPPPACQVKGAKSNDVGIRGATKLGGRTRRARRPRASSVILRVCRSRDREADSQRRGRLAPAVSMRSPSAAWPSPRVGRSTASLRWLPASSEARRRSRAQEPMGRSSESARSRRGRLWRPAEQHAPSFPAGEERAGVTVLLGSVLASADCRMRARAPPFPRLAIHAANASAGSRLLRQYAFLACVNVSRRR